MEEAMHMTGGCLCGNIKYETDADPVFTAVCHCTHCQRQAGTSFSVVVAVPAASLSMTGQLKTFEDTGESGQPVHRRFCPECGSPIISEVDSMPGLALIKAGTLDDTKWLKPTMELFCGSAQPWVPALADAKRFAKAPG
jgi:hypothetical protein